MTEETTKLTDEQRKAYVESGGKGCPYCEDGFVNGGSFDMEGGVVTQLVDCTECGRRWYDVYRLVNITEVN